LSKFILFFYFLFILFFFRSYILSETIRETSLLECDNPDSAVTCVATENPPYFDIITRTVREGFEEMIMMYVKSDENEIDETERDRGNEKKDELFFFLMKNLILEEEDKSRSISIDVQLEDASVEAGEDVDLGILDDNSPLSMTIIDEPLPVFGRVFFPALMLLPLSLLSFLVCVYDLKLVK
jgi:hypothetical protein